MWEIFVDATENDMHMYAKVGTLIVSAFFVNKYSKV
jgi:hypothetical protein